MGFLSVLASKLALLMGNENTVADLEDSAQTGASFYDRGCLEPEEDL